jgi:chromosome segregation ATPase
MDPLSFPPPNFSPPSLPTQALPPAPPQTYYDEEEPAEGWSTRKKILVFVLVIVVIGVVAYFVMFNKPKVECKQADCCKCPECKYGSIITAEQTQEFARVQTKLKECETKLTKLQVQDKELKSTIQQITTSVSKREQALSKVVSEIESKKLIPENTLQNILREVESNETRSKQILSDLKTLKSQIALKEIEVTKELTETEKRLKETDANIEKQKVYIKNLSKCSEAFQELTVLRSEVTSIEQTLKESKGEIARLEKLIQTRLAAERNCTSRIAQYDDKTVELQKEIRSLLSQTFTKSFQMELITNDYADRTSALKNVLVNM